jgi:hypothetical protein
MEPVSIFKQSNTQYILVANQLNTSYILKEKTCSEGASPAPVALTIEAQTTLTLEKDKTYSLRILEGETQILNIALHTYETMEYYFIRKFQKYICGCGCTNSCKEEDEKEILSLISVGQFLYTETFVIPSIATAVEEALFCKGNSILLKATRTTLMYGGDIGTPDMYNHVATELFLSLFIYEYTLASNKNDVLAKWRISQIETCLNTLLCSTLESLYTEVYSLPFEDPLYICPTENKPPVKATNLVYIFPDTVAQNVTSEQFLLNYEDPENNPPLSIKIMSRQAVLLEGTTLATSNLLLEGTPVIVNQVIPFSAILDADMTVVTTIGDPTLTTYTYMVADTGSENYGAVGSIFLFYYGDEVLPGVIPGPDNLPPIKLSTIILNIDNTADSFLNLVSPVAFLQDYVDLEGDAPLTFKLTSDFGNAGVRLRDLDTSTDLSVAGQNEVPWSTILNNELVLTVLDTVPEDFTYFANYTIADEGSELFGSIGQIMVTVYKASNLLAGIQSLNNINIQPDVTVVLPYGTSVLMPTAYVNDINLVTSLLWEVVSYTGSAVPFIVGSGNTQCTILNVGAGNSYVIKLTVTDTSSNVTEYYVSCYIALEEVVNISLGNNDARLGLNNIGMFITGELLDLLAPMLAVYNHSELLLPQKLVLMTLPAMGILTLGATFPALPVSLEVGTVYDLNYTPGQFNSQFRYYYNTLNSVPVLTEVSFTYYFIDPNGVASNIGTMTIYLDV